jgi:hypothetical protein
MCVAGAAAAHGKSWRVLLPVRFLLRVRLFLFLPHAFVRLDNLGSLRRDVTAAREWALLLLPPHLLLYDRCFKHGGWLLDVLLDPINLEL